MHYEVLGHCGKQVYLKPRMPDGDFAAMPESIADTMAQTMAAAASFREGLVELPAAPVPAPVIHVKLAAAAAHECLFVGHSTHTRDYIPEPTYLLDVPILRQLDVRPYRCQDCKRLQRGRALSCSRSQPSIHLALNTIVVRYETLIRIVDQSSGYSSALTDSVCCIPICALDVVVLFSAYQAPLSSESRGRTYLRLFLVSLPTNHGRAISQWVSGVTTSRRSCTSHLSSCCICCRPFMIQ